MFAYLHISLYLTLNDYFLNQTTTYISQDVDNSHKQLDEAGLELQELVTRNDDLIDSNRKLEAVRRQLMEQLDASSDSDESRSMQVCMVVIIVYCAVLYCMVSSFCCS